jgi:hypothetical protein
VQCAPCQQRRIDLSLEEAHRPQRKLTKSGEAFALRWRGFEWENIATMLGYTNKAAAQSAARDHAKKKGLTLP